MDQFRQFAEKKFVEINGRKMAYIDEGEGDPIVFQHGNVSSSYLWRKVMPACRGLGRLVACDLIGMGDSEKLNHPTADSYTYAENRDFLFALWEKLGIHERAVFVVHDWGAVLGLDWARQHANDLQGIVYMEALVKPLAWSDLPPSGRDTFRAFRSPAGEAMILDDNIFLEAMLIKTEADNLTSDDVAEYRKPFLKAGEDRRPMLTFPRQVPLDGEPADVAEIVEANAKWLQKSTFHKLWIKGDPGAFATASIADFCETLSNQTSLTVKGLHFLQESSGPEIGAAIARFVRGLRERT